MLTSQIKNDLDESNWQWNRLVSVPVYRLDGLYGKILQLHNKINELKKRVKALEEFRVIANEIAIEQEEEIKRLKLKIRRMQQPP